VARLAPLVDSAAASGDTAATEILSGAARQLASLAMAVRAQLWRPGDPVEIAYLGGVFQSRGLRERFRELVLAEAGNSCAAPLQGPAEGALLEAYRAAGLDVRLQRA
jgi:N-acetylglucosamine kinase-like BadF-type ATPase